MGAYSCAVGHDRCHVWVLGELFEHVGPDTVLFRACVELEDTVPLATTVWQFTPLGAGAQNPLNCLNATATLFLLPCVGTRVSLQKCVKFLPLMVGNSLCRHPTIVANVTELIKRQRDLTTDHCIWAFGPSALPCAGDAPPQRPALASDRAHSSLATCLANSGPPNTTVGAGLVPALARLTHRRRHSPKGPVRPGLAPALSLSKSR